VAEPYLPPRPDQRETQRAADVGARRADAQLDLAGVDLAASGAAGVRRQVGVQDDREAALLPGAGSTRGAAISCCSGRATSASCSPSAGSSAG
jgi:hypothetical protein